MYMQQEVFTFLSEVHVRMEGGKLTGLQIEVSGFGKGGSISGNNELPVRPTAAMSEGESTAQAG